MLLLGTMCGCDVATISRAITTTAVTFSTTFAGHVTMPPITTLQQQYFLGDNIIGALDGTDFKLAHPYSQTKLATNFYRGDKGHHFHLALILSDKNLRVIWAALGIPGHANDQGAYKQTNLFTWLAEQHHRVAILTDGGFTGPDFIRPVVQPVSPTGLPWNEVLRQERAGAEHANCYLKHWRILMEPFHGAHSLHTLVVFSILIIYNCRLTFTQIH